MIYFINFTKRSFKELEKVKPPYYVEIKEAILDLAQNPRPIGSKKLKGRNGYRIRVGMYRIIYEIIDSKLIINIITIGHRKDIYK